MKRLYSISRSLAILIAKPYIFRELPAWGYVFRLLVGGHRREWLWRGQRAAVVDKSTGFKLELDLGWWSDRMTYFLGRWYDLHSQLIIDEHIKPGDVVIDVGANRGMFALYASKRVGPSGRVMCFEPNPTCIDTLHRTIDMNGISNIEVRNVGLSDKPETLNLMIPSCDTGISSFASYGGELEETAVPCKVLVGDDALKNVAPTFIKIDVEGFEPKVIAGLKKTLREHRPMVYMEFVPAHLKRAGSNPYELINLMSAMNYRGRRVTYASRHPTYCSYVEITDLTTDSDILWVPL